VLLELAVGKEFFFLLCFSVNIERTGQDLRRPLGIGGRPRPLVLIGQDLPCALGIGGRPRALVLDLPRAIGIGGRQGDFFPIVLFCKCRVHGSGPSTCFGNWR
jgi:hypothetical protein